jgi:hypothetical protein
MGFRLRVDEPIADEIKRVVARQFDRAVTELRRIGDPGSDAAIHRARRRVKKIRAVIRLVRPALGETFPPLNKRLHQTIDLLAPVADGQGVVEAVDRLAQKYRDDFAEPALTSFRAGLVERELRADRRARVDRVLQRASATLRRERARIKRWRLKGAGFRPIAEGIEESCRRSRRAMLLTLRHPTAQNFHLWRRRVKDHWFQVRLIQARCGNRLRGYQRRLEALDDSLGEYHNFALLREIITADTSVPRQETARRLRVIRRYSGELRRQAQAQGARIYTEKPRDFVRRVRALWRLANVIHHVSS